MMVEMATLCIEKEPNQTTKTTFALLHSNPSGASNEENKDKMLNNIDDYIRWGDQKDIGRIKLEHLQRMEARGRFSL